MAELNEPLSEREQEVLELLAQGAANKEIAASLFISPNTVKVHLRNINTKLGSKSRTEASRIALERGLVIIPGMEPAEPNGQSSEGSDANESHEESINKGEDAQFSPALEPKPTAEPASAPVSNITNWYLAGGLILLLALIGLVVWFIFNPNSSEPAAVEPFEPVSIGDAWFESRPLPESLSGISAVSVGNDIYLTGGQQNDGELNDDLYVYNTIDRVWTTRSSKPNSFINSASVSLEQVVYIAGGEDAQGNATDIAEVYIPSDDVWRSVANLPQPVSDGLALSDQANLYHIGGHSNGAISNVYAFDPLSNSWAELPSLPEGRTGAAGGIVEGTLYVIGGANAAGEATADCFMLDLSKSDWEACTPMGNGRIGASGTVILGQIYIIGGETGAPFGERYNPESGIWDKIDQPMVAGLDNPSWTNAGAAGVESKMFLFGGEFSGTMTDDAYFYSPLAYQLFIPAATNDE
ncbi:MAG: kelch repeat-containing protein [Chloroflexota bacterium]